MFLSLQIKDMLLSFGSVKILRNVFQHYTTGRPNTSSSKNICTVRYLSSCVFLSRLEGILNEAMAFSFPNIKSRFSSLTINSHRGEKFSGFHMGSL